MRLVCGHFKLKVVGLKFSKQMQKQSVGPVLAKLYFKVGFDWAVHVISSLKCRSLFRHQHHVSYVRTQDHIVFTHIEHLYGAPSRKLLRDAQCNVSHYISLIDYSLDFFYIGSGFMISNERNPVVNSSKTHWSKLQIYNLVHPAVQTRRRQPTKPSNKKQKATNTIHSSNPSLPNTGFTL